MSSGFGGRIHALPRLGRQPEFIPVVVVPCFSQRAEMAHAFGRPELPRSLLPFQARLPRGFHEFNHVNIDLAKGLSKTCGMTSLVVNWLILNAPMSTITAFEAKTRFGELLDRVAKGEEVVITRHDKAVARMVPEGVPRLTEVRLAVAGLRTLRQEIQGRHRGKAKLTDGEVRAAIEEGRL